MENLWKKEELCVNLFPFVPKDITFKAAQLVDTDSRKNDQQSTELRKKGNAKYGNKRWADALELYTQSLCYAENGSENVALAYSNRSACFLKMEMYTEALNDIELATKANAPEHLLSKLEERKREALKLEAKAKEKTSYKYEVKLGYAANTDYPGMADIIIISGNRDLGRQLIAKTDFPVGQTILLEENYVMVRKRDKMSCEHCYKECASFIACEHCPDVVFCSGNCKNKNPYHALECNMKQVDASVLFQVRAIAMAIDAFDSVENLMQFVEKTLRENPMNLPTSLLDKKSKYHFYFKLQKAEWNEDDLDEMTTMYRNIASYPKIAALFDTEEKQRFLMHLVSEAFIRQ